VLLVQRSQGCQAKASRRWKLWLKNSLLASRFCEGFVRWPGNCCKSSGMKLSVLMLHAINMIIWWMQRQWWDFKSKHMDKVLFFKVLIGYVLLVSLVQSLQFTTKWNLSFPLLLEQMGKFYELFEMDAHVGAKELDLQYMKVSMSTLELWIFVRILRCCFCFCWTMHVYWLKCDSFRESNLIVDFQRKISQWM
jgi:hypothetical protein